MTEKEYQELRQRWIGTSSPYHDQEDVTGIPTIPEGSNFGDAMLVCPECGIEFIHPTGLRCNPAGKSGKQVTIDNDGINTHNANLDGKDGVEITLQFECEDGHLFQYVLQFHEGKTFIGRNVIDLANTQLSCRTIWRT